MSTFLETMKCRRSQYALGKKVALSDESLTNLVKEAVLHTPTAFNMQSGKAIILFHEHHELFWDKTKESLRTMIPADRFQATEDKMEAFKEAYGTVLFFDDTTITNEFAEQFTLYKDNFTPWALQSNGMLQFALWNIFTENGLGASLQHYNPLIDEIVYETWNVAKSWKLIAQMPFGTITGKVGIKSFDNIEQRVITYK